MREHAALAAVVGSRGPPRLPGETARRELEREDRVARLRRGGGDGHVRLRARVRLDVGVLGPEELLGPVDRELLDLVDALAAAVVPPARVALRVLVRRRRPDRLED